MPTHSFLKLVDKKSLKISIVIRAEAVNWKGQTIQWPQNWLIDWCLTSSKLNTNQSINQSINLVAIVLFVLFSLQLLSWLPLWYLQTLLIHQDNTQKTKDWATWTPYQNRDKQCVHFNFNKTKTVETQWTIFSNVNFVYQFELAKK
jgi:hypothetical protein